MNITPLSPRPAVAFAGNQEAPAKDEQLSPKAVRVLDSFTPKARPLNPEQVDKDLAALKEMQAEIESAGRLVGIASWDLETKPLKDNGASAMPDNAKQLRGGDIARASTELHKKFVSDERGLLLENLSRPEALADIEKRHGAHARRFVEMDKKEYDLEKQLPENLVRDWNNAVQEAKQSWDDVYNADGDFEDFQPALTNLVDLAREKAKIYQKAGGYETRYDALLDQFEEGMTSRQLDEIFAPLKTGTADVLDEIQKKQQLDTSAVDSKTYPERIQLKLGKLMADKVGFNSDDGGRLAKSTHPFTSTVTGRDDVGITIRTNEHNLFDVYSGATHEAGHGNHRQGAGDKAEDSFIGGMGSLGIAETQSRIIEKFATLRPDYMKSVFPEIQKLFKDGAETEAAKGNKAKNPLADVTPTQFFRAGNRVEPSLIRVDADEVTYNYHPILRYELERDLINGELEVKDLRDAWNQKYEDYLGIKPDSDKEGVLQDVHWSMGAFGYFSSYALGNIGAAQLYKTAVEKNPEIEKALDQGDAVPLKKWLNKNVHEDGNLYKPQELLKKVTGESYNAEHLVNYFRDKYSDNELYGIRNAKEAAEDASLAQTSRDLQKSLDGFKAEKADK